MKKFLIAGLGNPGKKYENTRHNIGFLAVDEFAKDISETFKQDSNAHYLKCNYDESELIIIKPQEFMNLSGKAVTGFVKKYSIEYHRLLVVYDEIDFPFGKVKWKVGGGNAGHNGVGDIIERIGTKDFNRIRIGIGRPPLKELVSEYVLQSFTPEEKLELPKIFKETTLKIHDWLKKAE